MVSSGFFLCLFQIYYFVLPVNRQNGHRLNIRFHYLRRYLVNHLPNRFKIIVPMITFFSVLFLLIALNIALVKLGAVGVENSEK